ncbi:MAG: helix-turn-helix transcriptional regulator [Pseudomonadota bacterium]
MEHAQDTLAREVSERLSALGTNAFAVENSAGLPADAVRSILRGGKKAGTTLNRAQDVCNALGLQLYIGPRRDSGAVQVIDREAEYAHIPVHDAMLAAGAGAFNGAEEVVDFLAFRRDWLRRLGLDPSRAVIARATGDSMQPCVWHGDLVLIDLSRIDPPMHSRPDRGRRAPVFALLDEGAAKIKRVQWIEPGLAVLLSDNPDYAPTFARAENLSIIGKVVWWGHTSRD